MCPLHQLHQLPLLLPLQHSPHTTPSTQSSWGSWSYPWIIQHSTGILQGLGGPRQSPRSIPLWQVWLLQSAGGTTDSPAAPRLGPPSSPNSNLWKLNLHQPVKQVCSHCWGVMSCDFWRTEPGLKYCKVISWKQQVGERGALLSIVLSLSKTSCKTLITFYHFPSLQKCSLANTKGAPAATAPLICLPPLTNLKDVFLQLHLIIASLDITLNNRGNLFIQKLKSLYNHILQENYIMNLHLLFYFCVLLYRSLS